MIEKFKNIKNIKNIHWLNRYIKFIEEFKLGDELTGKTHNHHILPRSLYPEYADLKTNVWNKAILPIRAHLIAHYMLAKALGGNMWFAYNNMNCHNIRLKTRLYDIGIKNMRTQMCQTRQGVVSAMNICTGEKICVSKEEFERNLDLVGVTKGLFVGDNNVSKRMDVRNKISIARQGFINVIINETGKMTSIHRDLFDESKYTKPTNTSLHNSLICVYDENKNIIQIENSHPKFLDGTYKHINSGRKRSEKSIEKQKSHYTEETKQKRSDNAKRVYESKLLNVNEFGLDSIKTSIIMCDVTKVLKKPRKIYYLHNKSGEILTLADERYIRSISGELLNFKPLEISRFIKSKNMIHFYGMYVTLAENNLENIITYLYYKHGEYIFQHPELTNISPSKFFAST